MSECVCILCVCPWVCECVCVVIYAAFRQSVPHGCIYDGGNLVRRDLRLSWYLDAYIFNLLCFTTDCCYTLNRCMELYYICASSVFGKKKNRECTWLTNGVLRSRAGEAAGMFTNQYSPAAHINCYCINPRHSRERQAKGVCRKETGLVLTSYWMLYPRVEPLLWSSCLFCALSVSLLSITNQTDTDANRLLTCSIHR